MKRLAIVGLFLAGLLLPLVAAGPGRPPGRAAERRPERLPRLRAADLRLRVHQDRDHLRQLRPRPPERGRPDHRHAPADRQRRQRVHAGLHGPETRTRGRTRR
ncbi:MAG: hypothetical protein M0C28_35650 [Candidatus Moduliflexus flocculans]|nr:hypothetical protein [Candidatus Moduliflexus flocculans]